METTKHFYKPGEGMPGAIYTGRYTPLQKTLLEDLYHILLPEITMTVTRSRPDNTNYTYTYDIIFIFPSGEKRLFNPSLIQVLALYKEILSVTQVSNHST